MPRPRSYRIFACRLFFCKGCMLFKTTPASRSESYDKVSKLLGLGYPGGPVIEKLAQDGNPKAIDFPRAYLPESLDFSFSGLKTAVLNFSKSEVRSKKKNEEDGKGKGNRNIYAIYIFVHRQCSYDCSSRISLPQNKKYRRA